MAAILWLFLGFVATQSVPAQEVGLFYGYQGCLAVTENQSLSRGERLVILAADVGSAEIRVGTVRRPSEGSECWNAFRGEPPSRIAGLSLSPLRDEVFFGVRPHGQLVIVGGPSVQLPAAETEQWTRAVSTSLPGAWRASDVLAHAYRYATSDGKATVVELYLGLPEWSPRGTWPPIKSITIRRFFFVNGQPLASEQYERVSGREERVDTQPPELTVDDWSASETERTVGFVSEDEGRSWTRLSIDVGFEGIWWIAQALRSGLPRTYEHYLYTFH
jgi:hypothetical protein